MLGHACHVRLGVGGRGSERCTHISQLHTFVHVEKSVVMLTLHASKSHTHTISLSFPLSHTHSLSFSLANAFFLIHRHSNTLTHSHTHNHTHTLTHSYTHTHIQKRSLLALLMCLFLLRTLCLHGCLFQTHTHTLSHSLIEREKRAHVNIIKTHLAASCVSVP